MTDEYIEMDFSDLNQADLDCYLDNPEDYRQLDNIPPVPFPANPPESVKANPPDIIETVEQVPQTSASIETKNFAGNYNFRVNIEEIDSKFYCYSDKLKRLFCNMDKGVPIKLFWEGPPMLRVRAVLAYYDADDICKPVVRCRSHKDTTAQNNRDCERIVEHVIRCDNEKSVYNKNGLSLRLSVVTSINNNPDSDGVRVVYRFMCSNSCGGPDAIARRNTNLILTLEDNSEVVGRVVIGVKICSCPWRDRRKAEADGGTKKRKSQEVFVDADSKKVKKENCTVTGDRQQLVTGAAIKQEGPTVGPEEFINLQVSIPNFPARHVGDLVSVMKRIVASYYARDEDIAAITENVQIYQV